MFWNLVLLVASFALNILLTPKPPDAKAAGLDDFEAPRAEEGIEIPVLFGTRFLKAPNVVWYGDLDRKAIKGARRYGFFGPRQTTGHRYFLGVHMVLCHGPADALKQVIVSDDKRLWTGSIADGRVYVSKKDASGPSSGDIKGYFDVCMGAPSQVQNDYLVSKLGADVPAFRGVVSIILRRMELGESPYIAPWAFILQRIFLRSDGSAQWYPAKAGIRSSAGVVVSAFLKGSDGGDGSRIGLQFLDATDTPLQSDVLWDDWVIGSEWTTAVLSAAPPAGSAKVRVWMGFNREAGDTTTAYIDNITVDYNGSALAVVNPDAEGGTTGWTNSVGTLGTFTPVGGDGVAFRTTSAEGKAYQDISLSAVTGSGSGAGVHMDMNPAHIIRECLTDRMWGMGYAEADIDDASFMAAADTLYDEGFGLSFTWAQEVEIQEFVTMVLGHIDGVLYVSRETGLFVLKLIRNDYELDELPVLEETDVVQWNEVTRRQPAEVVNSVVVKYHDADRRKDSSYSVHNAALIQQMGEMISTTRDYNGITNAGLAVRVGTRDLKTLSAGMITGTITCKRTVESLYPGDAFRLVSERHRLDGDVMRVIDMSFGDGRDNKIKIKFAQDVFDLGLDPLVDSVDGEWEDPSNVPQPVVLRVTEEAPYHQLRLMVGSADASEALATDPDAGVLQIAAARPTSDSLTCLAYVSEGSAYEVIDEEIDFSPGGYCDHDLGPLPSDIDLVLRNHVDVQSITEGMLGVIDQEIVRVTSAAGPSLTLARGCLDTLPAEHAEGTPIVFIDEPLTDYELRTAGTTVTVRLQPSTPRGVLPLLSSATDTVNYNSRAIRPYPPGQFKMNGSYEQNREVTGVTTLTWDDRNRTAQTTALGHDEAWSGASEAGVTYRVTVEGLDINDDVVGGAPFIDVNVGTATNYEYDKAAEPPPVGAQSLRFSVRSVRDGYDCWQIPSITGSLIGFVLTSGDEQVSGVDAIKLSGDEGDGNVLLSGDASDS